MITLTADTHHADLNAGTEWQLRVSDTLDFSDYRQVQLCLQQIPTDAPRVVIDLSDARHIDSSGLGCLLQVYEFCRQHGIALVFNISNERHQQLLQRTGLWKLFAVAEHALTTDGFDGD